MKKILSLVLALTTMTSFSSIGINRASAQEKVIKPHYEPIKEKGKLDTLEKVMDRRGIYDLRGWDVSDLDLTEISIVDIKYDSQTKFPKGYRKSENLNQVERFGKDPGLNVRELHKKGITGEGVNVAIIDTKLVFDHIEFKDRIKFYEEIVPMDEYAHYHGTPITSILAGKNVGVAPNVNIYYIAHTDKVITSIEDSKEYWRNLGKAIKRVVEINASLPQEEKIKVLSISSGWYKEEEYEEDTKEIYEGLEMAKAQGIFVVSAMLNETHNLKFNGLNRKPLDDPNDFNSYGIFSYPEEYGEEERVLLLPQDSRFMAGPTRKNQYVYYPYGGWSMAVPYISGLYALACQVNNTITPEEFWEKALITGEPITSNNSEYKYKNARIVNPIELIKNIKK